MTFSLYRIWIFIGFFVTNILLYVVSSYSADSNVNNHTSGKSWLSASDDAYNDDDSFFISLNFELGDGWHIYWQNPGDSGLPVEIKWVLPSGFDAKPIHWTIPNREVLLGITSFVYSGNAELLIPITPSKIVNTPNKIVLEAKAEWLACKDICIPESATYYLTLDKSGVGDIVNKIGFSKLPKLLKNSAKYQTLADKVTIQIKIDNHQEISSLLKDNKIANVDLFAIDTGIISHKPVINSYISDEYITMTFNKAGYQVEMDKWKGLLLLSNDSGEQYGFNLTLENGEIYPVVKTSNPIIKDDACVTGDEGYDTKSCGITDDLTSVKSENISFIVALLFAFIGGVILNAMPCVLPILSLKLMGLVNKLNLSRGLVWKHSLAYTAGIMSCFLSIAGLLIILQQGGAAIGWGFQLQSPVFVTFLVILFFIIGLNLSGLFEIPSIMGNVGNDVASKDNPTGSFFTGALAALVATPCTVPFMAPAVGFALTRSPVESLLVFAMLGFGMAVPYLLLSLSPTLSRLIPKPGAWMYKLKLWLALPMYATALWLLWVLFHQTKLEIIIYVILALSSIFLLLLLYKKILNYRWLSRSILASLLILIVAVLCVSYQQSNDNIAISSRGEAFSLERIKELRNEGKAVFVDATAEWCLTCKINEITTLSRHEVMSHFKENNITLMVADWTNKDEVISKYLASFNRQGVPVYVFYPADGSQPKLLPQLLTPNIVIEETSD